MESAELSPEPATPPALPEAPLDKVCEFPDGLSPMLVKELRQGLRTYTFTTVFLTLQGILTIVLLVAGSAAGVTDSTAAGNVVSKVVFCFYALALLAIQPLRGISAVSSEVSRNTIDLMVLTRLSAWRIVWGKWCCIVGQSALILLTILPYLIFRYFFGGMQLFSELFLLVYVFVVSAALTAVAIGISALGSGLIRGVVVVGGGSMLVAFVLFRFTPQLEHYVAALSLASTGTFLIAIGLLALTIYTGYFFLELATAFVAPAAENRSTRKRLIGLGVAVIGFVAVQFEDTTLAVVTAGVVGLLLSFDLFTERAEFPSSVTRPFLRLGGFGRLCGRILYPGWATGTLFFLVFAAVLALLTLASSQLRGDGITPWIALGVALGVMVFPAAMVQLFSRRSESRHTSYLGVAAVSWLLAVILTMLHGVVSEDLLLWIFCPMPMVQAPMIPALGNAADRSLILPLAWASVGVYWLVVFAGAVRELRKLADLEREELSLEDADEG